MPSSTAFSRPCWSWKRSRETAHRRGPAMGSSAPLPSPGGEGAPVRKLGRMRWEPHRFRRSIVKGARERPHPSSGLRREDSPLGRETPDATFPLSLRSKRARWCCIPYSPSTTYSIQKTEPGRYKTYPPGSASSHDSKLTTHDSFTPPPSCAALRRRSP